MIEPNNHLIDSPDIHFSKACNVCGGRHTIESTWNQLLTWMRKEYGVRRGIFCGALWKIYRDWTASDEMPCPKCTGS